MNGSLQAQAPSVPTGADLNWRAVFPGQWSYDGISYLWANSLKGGQTTPAQVRGYGYLTGFGHGALGLPEADAVRIQAQVGAVLAAAPDLLAFAVELDASWTESFPDGPDGPCEVFGGIGRLGDDHRALWQQCRAAIRKATPPAETGSVGTEPKAECTQ